MSMSAAGAGPAFLCLNALSIGRQWLRLYKPLSYCIRLDSCIGCSMAGYLRKMAHQAAESAQLQIP